ncbi:MAG: protein-L-isoaspartate(D-aspartate) O-methyltransferase [Phycisphaerae bacterium]
MTSQDTTSQQLREQMVRTQLESRQITDRRVLDAFREIPRERFIPSASAREAYADAPVPIGFGQTISQPYIVALMLQELRVKPEHRVLDVGMGSGYQTALLAKLAGHVYAIERIPELTERSVDVLASLNLDNVTAITGDGSLGWPEEAPFDRIVCGAGGPEVPDPWLEQLAEGGRLVMPVGSLHAQTLIACDKRDGEIERHDLCGVRFVRLIGKEGWTDRPTRG